MPLIFNIMEYSGYRYLSVGEIKYILNTYMKKGQSFLAYYIERCINSLIFMYLSSFSIMPVSFCVFPGVVNFFFSVGFKNIRSEYKYDATSLFIHRESSK